MRLTVSGMLSIAACTGLFLGSSIEQVEARDFNVNCAEGLSIQDRIDQNAKEGDTINVYGSCTENIIIRKDNLTLNCIDGATISSAGGATIGIRATEVKINDCNITGSSSTGTGVIVQWSGSAKLTDNHIFGLRTGVVATHSSYLQLVGSTAPPATRSQIISGNRTGISIVNTSSADIVRTEISGNGGSGVLIARNAHADILGNDISNNGLSNPFGRGVTMIRASSAEFSSDVAFDDEANTISGNAGGGIGCFQSGVVGFGPTPQNFSGNTGSGDFLPTNCTVVGSP